MKTSNERKLKLKDKDRWKKKRKRRKKLRKGPHNRESSLRTNLLLKNNKLKRNQFRDLKDNNSTSIMMENKELLFRKL